MKSIGLHLLVLLVFSNNQLWGQDIHYVEVGINGLHCSACTYSVEKSLKKLPFVSVVSMDLNERNGLVYFKEESEVRFSQIAKAVVDAGFSVRSVEVELRASLSEESNCYYEQLCIIDPPTANSKRLKLLGKKYQGKKQLDQQLLNQSCDCPDQSNVIKAVAL